MTDTSASACPPWCDVPHDGLDGEDAHVHVGRPLTLTDGVTARLVTARATAPYVLVGEEERTLGETAALGSALIDLAETGAPREPAAPRTPPPDPSPAAS